MARRHDRIERRLSFFVARGELERAPTRWQLFAGWLAMLPVTLGESPRERAVSRRTWLGQVPIRAPLQALYCPRQAWVDTGLAAPADAIVKHLVSVFHEDAFLGYDLQLLASEPGGLDLLEREAERHARGRGLVSRGLRSMVGDPGYHARLAEHARRAMASAYPASDLDPRFASLVGFARFCLTLPAWPELSFYGFDLGRLGGGR
ncbi:MAG TPA: hypothetical protein VFS43_11210 [Polyangiaceae bacterium]|nr:hypothetical protein [Polyangiaceae bacterium]